MPAKERNSIVMRTNSYTTELSSCVSSISDSDYLMESSLRVNDLTSKKSLKHTNSNSSSTTTSSSTKRSSSLLEMTHNEFAAMSLLPKLTPVLIVKTQADSVKSSIDDKLKANTAVATHTVSFAKLHIREFPRRPGCNPGCRIGVSLELDWEIQDEQTIGIDEYETSRPTRRDRGELNIPSEMRMQMLRDSGYSRGEILQYVKMANIARGQRTRTNETLQLAGAQEFAQKIFRGVRNKTTHRTKKKKEKAVLRMSLIQDQKLVQLRRMSAPAVSTTSKTPVVGIEQAPRTEESSSSSSSSDDYDVDDFVEMPTTTSTPITVTEEVDC
ncbi:expressed unknown protein [Seminavis robusta]|uniref:Uncharacterized protein n=1 Tax=Seminavis robusta TaxID=568900 RepID=A0A9N8EE69_9STRA|nr:expressed unknown protein [Seminavis robusta]|eukprot:Sro1049_g235420.1 n/a (327) ;mRNA; f:26048-27028